MQEFKRFGQASTEYLMVIAFSLLLLTPIIIIGNDAVADLKSRSDYVIARDAVNKIADMATIVYSQGPPAKITEKIRFPSNIISTTVSDQLIIIRVDYKSLPNDIPAVVEFNVSGHLPTTPGVHNIRIEAIDYGVNITVVP